MTEFDDDYLRYQIATCHRCPLGAIRDAAMRVSVPAHVGKYHYKGGLAILAEAPGAIEEQTGQPMMGPAGKFLDQLLNEIGVSRDDIMILNRIRCRPPKNKIDSKEAVAAVAECDPWLRAELEMYDPGVVLLMGATAMKFIFGEKIAVGKTRGHVRTTDSDFPYGKRTWVGTAHPAAVLHGDSHWGPLILQDLELAMELVSK